MQSEIKMNAPIEKWLREEVGKSCDEYAADPSIGIPADEVMARVRASYRARQPKSVAP
jgi:antitoxin ParD1/3/4